MAKFHISPETGNPGACKAKESNCPFAGANEHWDTKEEARAAYESKMTSPFSESGVSIKDRRVWGNLARISPDRTNQLGAPEKTQVTLEEVRKRPRPINWDEMGSSEKDMWEERQLKSGSSSDDLKVWRDGLAKKAEDAEWLGTLSDPELNRLSTIVVARNSAEQKSFDETPYPLASYSALQIRREIDKRIRVSKEKS